MMAGPNTQHSYVPQAPTLPAPNQGGYAPTPPFDTTGQVAPPGMKPRVTATLWEDEGSLCFQVEAKGVCVARREGMIDLLFRSLFPCSHDLRQPLHKWY